MFEDHPDLSIYFENKNFKVHNDHMTRTIEPPISPQVLSTYPIEVFDSLILNVKFPEDVLALWVGYSGERLFQSENDVQYRFCTYLPWLKVAPDEIQNIAKSIIYEIKTHGDKYDIPSILLALAQNGGVCAIQKEVGLRMVYASMTDSILQHVNSESIETKILLMLRNLRETLTEQTAQNIIKARGMIMNTHYIIPIRNKMAPSIGLTVIKDQDQYVIDDINHIDEFMQFYTVEKIVTCLRIALNDAPRKLDYLDVLSFLEKHKPLEVDEYEFKEEFLFDVSKGYFTDAGIRFLLHKMKIFREKAPGEADDPDTTSSISEPRKRVEDIDVILDHPFPEELKHKKKKNNCIIV